MIDADKFWRGVVEELDIKPQIVVENDPDAWLDFFFTTWVGEDGEKPYTQITHYYIDKIPLVIRKAKNDRREIGTGFGPPYVEVLDAKVEEWVMPLAFNRTTKDLMMAAFMYLAFFEDGDMWLINNIRQVWVPRDGF